MNLIIRQEKDSDHQAVFDLIEKAFRMMEKSDHQEHFLVEKLRNSEAFVPELSLVAEFGGKIIGHILLTKIKIISGDKSFDSLALAPVSVSPSVQKKGVGKELMKAAHRKAKDLGYKSIVVVGHPEYYPKFGYEKLQKYSIELPFEVPPEAAMIVEIAQNGLQGVSGKVEYAKEFYE